MAIRRHRVGDVEILVGDVRAGLAELADQSVQCVVTSPPYWGLRDYGTASWEGGDAGCDHQPPDEAGQTNKPSAGQRVHAGRFAEPRCHKCGARRIDSQIGLEPTLAEYVATMVAVFREVRRVLRADGTVWLNLGDGYYAGGWECHRRNQIGSGSMDPGERASGIAKNIDGLKAKDLIGIPWRVALALQADGAASPATMAVVARVRAALLVDFECWEAVPDKTRAAIEGLDREWADAQRGGWWLRAEIIWSKPNPMPESVTDRPTRAHEQVFLLTRSARYFYDAEAVREAAEYGYREHSSRWVSGTGNADGHRSGGGSVTGRNPESGRNKRTVWTIPTQAYPEAHFATFPEKLVEPCIRAGTSAKGCCPKCGTPWRRVVERTVHSEGRGRDHIAGGDRVAGQGWEGAPRASLECRTIGWQLGCKCDAGEHGKPAEPVRCTVLDPFFGSGTVGVVALTCGQRCIGIELQPEYVAQAVRRISRGSELYC